LQILGFNSNSSQDFTFFKAFFQFIFKAEYFGGTWFISQEKLFLKISKIFSFVISQEKYFFSSSLKYRTSVHKS